MKKLFKILLAVMLFAFVGTMASCHTLSEANLYRKWSNVGCELAKAHVYEEISYKKLISKVEDLKEGDDTIYVFYGSTSNSSSTTNVIVYNEQAIQYEIPVVYWLDAEDLSDKVKTKLEETLGIKDADKQGVLWSFMYQEDSDTNLYFDGSKVKYQENTNTKNAELCFNDKLDD